MAFKGPVRPLRTLLSRWGDRLRWGKGLVSASQGGVKMWSRLSRTPGSLLLLWGAMSG